MTKIIVAQDAPVEVVLDFGPVCSLVKMDRGLI